ncbi:cyanophycinase [Bacillus sp. CGMCC 1.16541]|uniref:cyanophycinase n=1 Tax=Bacillus sp. CGMCC 1.16541 TaxID=2185143 RepID=UPI001EF5B576|nr:cyanophycinase [Bacillus sp. CGMCC 1.16541]
MKKWITMLVAFVLVSTLWFPSIGQAKKKEEEIKGNLVIAGGALGSSNKAVYEEFIKLAGGKEKAKVGIIPAASSSLKSSEDFKKDLLSYGLTEKQIQILPLANRNFSGTEKDESTWKMNAYSPKLAAQVKGLSAIWFVGGDQLRITDTLIQRNGKQTVVLKAIWEMYRNGGVIGGTSAGAAVMSDVMITGGDSLGGLNNKFVYEDVAGSSDEYAPVYLEKGLGFFPYGIVDQHFDERARLGRLVMTALKQPKASQQNFAYGVDEDTALVVNNKEKKVKVVGRSGVSIVDVSQAKRVKAGKANLKDVYISHLVEGDELNVQTKEFTISDHKDETNGYEYYEFQPLEATGVFTSYGRLKEYLSYSLVDNKETEVKSYLYDSKGKGFQLTFRKTDKTKGYWGYKDGQKDDYSFVNVAMDVEPKTVSFKEENDLFSDYKPSTFKLPTIDREKPVKGNLVIAGGAVGSSNAALYEKFIDLSKQKKDSKIGIIPAASSSLKSSESFKKDLVKYGMKVENIDILPLSVTNYKGTAEDESKWIDNKNNEELANKVRELDGIWFVGGDQTKITASLLNEDGSNSHVLNAIWDMYRDGAVLGGTSAGAAIMSDVMIAGGGSFDTLASGFTETYDGMLQQEGGPGYLERGLGFFEHGIIDQHFDNKARLGRLVAVTKEHGDIHELSYGIDEDTAMVVYNEQNKVEVVGRGGVTLVDLSKQSNDETLGQSEYKNIGLSWITQGDEFNFKTKETTINSKKVETKGYEYGNSKVPPHSGVLSGHGLLNKFLAYNLVDNEGEEQVESYSFNDGKGFKLVFRKTDETNGYWAYTDGQKDDYSFVNVSLDITPVTVTIK